MKTTEIRKEVELLGVPSPAIIVAKRGGQRPIEEGDEIIVSAWIFLPRQDKHRWLHSSISFEKRLFIDKVPLSDENWDFSKGFPELDETHMKREKSFIATKWNAAFASAMEWAETEVKKLTDAVEARHQALIDAEE